MAASGAAILTATIINVVTGLIAFFIFSLLRAWPRTAPFYDAKRDSGPERARPHALPRGLLSWLPPVWRYSEADVITHCGLDTAVYLRILRFGLELFLLATAWALVTILPTNYTDDETERLMASSGNTTSSDGQFAFTTFDKLSLANVGQSSNRMWVHLISVYVLTGATLWMLWRYSRDSVVLRIMYLANSGGADPAGAAAGRSLLVQDVPGVAGVAAAAAAAEAAKAKKESKSAAASPEKPAPGAAAGAAVAAEPAAASSPVAAGDVVVLDMPAAASAAPASELRRRFGARADDVAAVAPVARRADGVSAGGAAGGALFSYDTNDSSLDPDVVAKQALDGGLPPQEMVAAEFTLVYGSLLTGTGSCSRASSSGSAAAPGAAAAPAPAVHMVYNTSALDPLVNEYNQIKQTVEDYIDECTHKAAKRAAAAGGNAAGAAAGADEAADEAADAAPKVLLLLPLYGEWGVAKYGRGLIKRVDAMDFWSSRLRWLEGRIAEEQQKALKAGVQPAAFVTFSSRLAAAVGSTCLHHHSEAAWRTRAAPQPGDVIWGNLGLNAAQRKAGWLSMLTLFVLMVFFFMIPISAIQGLIDVPKLASYPGLKSFVDNVVVRKLLEAIVPGLALKIFLALVPLILTIMMRKSGAVANSQVDFGVVSRFYTFQVIVVFAGTVIAGSFFSQAKQWIEDPASVVSVLGTAIPQTTTFFITYILVNGLAAKPLGFTRIVPAVIYLIKNKLTASPAARKRLYREQYTTYGTSVCDHTMAIMLGLVYSCINPIICPAVLAYFVVVYTIERYNHIFVLRVSYDSAGAMWSRVFSQVMVALYIFQLTMIGLLAIKKFPFAPLIIPLLLATLAFHISASHLFGRPWVRMSLHDAAELDLADAAAAAQAAAQRLPGSAAGEGKDAAEGGKGATEEKKEKEGQGEGAQAASDAYLSPVFKVEAGAADALLSEAQRWASRLQQQRLGSEVVA